MNRTLSNVLFGGIASEAASDYKIEGTVTQINVDDTADALANADSVILVRRASALQPRRQVEGRHVGRRLWNGRRGGPTPYRRNRSDAESQRDKREVRNPSGCGTNAGPV